MFAYVVVSLPFCHYRVPSLLSSNALVCAHRPHNEKNESSKQRRINGRRLPLFTTLPQTERNEGKKLFLLVQSNCARSDQ